MSDTLMGIIQAGSTLILVCITAWYAWTTRKMLSHMKQDVAARVNLSLSLSQRVVFFTLINTGKKPAHNLRISLDNEKVGIKPLRMKSLYELPFLKDSISYLPPGERYKYRVGQLDVDFVEENHPVMKFILNYEDGFDSIQEKIEIKLLDYIHIIQRSFMEPTDGIVNALRGIQSELESNDFSKDITSGLSSKSCPVCGEWILEEARKCKHCLEWLPENSIE